ncbi:hypothetical protein Btru_041810 [Bulinus truncatus]|nr:hypothetical protein Btru_041810 [Bulinus truncatus]
MQSEIIAQISGFFGGKNKRKEVDLSNDKNHESMTIGELIAEKFRRKSESAIAIEGLANKKRNGAIKTNGINLVRIAKLDFISQTIYHQLPARHFSIDGDDDLPPPIPERKSSLDTIIDEGFQRRFSFRPIATVPLPEPLSGIKKIYPSQTLRRNVPQRPPSQPPPPPPPPDTSSPATSSVSNISFGSSAQLYLHYDFEDDDDEDFLPPPPPPPPSIIYDITPPTKGASPPPSSSTAKRTATFWKSSSGGKLAGEPPPPPTRPLPPPPQSKRSDAMYKSSPNLVQPENPATSGSPKPAKLAFHSTTREMKLLKLKTAKSEPNLDVLDSSPTSPPPLPARPALLSPVLNQKPAKLSETKGPVKSAGNRAKERPKLPAKPVRNGSKSPPNSQTIKKTTDTPQIKPGKQALIPTTVTARQSPPCSPHRSPVPGAPNKNRPLPAPPMQTDDKKMSKVKGKVDGQEVYNPREEDGDMYDVMESTNI